MLQVLPKQQDDFRIRTSSLIRLKSYESVICLLSPQAFAVKLGRLNGQN
jgi:hypothetical protein